MIKIFSICSKKGGSSKSTLTLCFSNCLASEGKKVLIIDCDEQRSIFDFYRYKKANDNKESVLFDVVAITEWRKVAEHINNNSDKYDFVFLDIPRFTDKNDVNAFSLLSMCDNLLIPFQSGVVELQSLFGFLKVVDELKSKKKKLKVFGIQTKVKNTNLSKETFQIVSSKIKVLSSTMKDVKFFLDIPIFEHLLSSNEGAKRFSNIYNEFKTNFKI